MGKFRSYLRRGTAKEPGWQWWEEEPGWVEYLCEAGGGFIEWEWEHQNPHKWWVDMEETPGNWVHRWEYDGDARDGTLWYTVCPSQESHRLRLYGVDENHQRITAYRVEGPFHFQYIGT